MKPHRNSNLNRLIGRVNNAIGAHRGIVVALTIALVVQTAFVLGTNQFQLLFGRANYDDFRVGSPAPRDLFADRTVTYVDDEATQIRTEAIEQLVAPVYQLNTEISDRGIETFDRFASILLARGNGGRSAETIHLELQAELPNVVPRALVDNLVSVGNFASIVAETRDRLEAVYSAGVVDSWSDELPSDEIAIRTTAADGDNVISIVPRSSLVVLEEDARPLFGADENIAPAVETVIQQTVETFLQTNLFFDAAQTSESRSESVRSVEAVVDKIVKGERLIEKGMIVSEDDLERIGVLSETYATRTSSKTIATTLLVILTFLLSLVLFRPSEAIRVIRNRQIYLLAGVTSAHTIAVFFVLRFVTLPAFVIPSVLLPSALGAMIVALLINPRSAISLSLIQAILVLVATDFEPYNTLFVFTAGVSGTLVVQGAEKRLDLMRASLLLAAALAVFLAILGMFRADTLPQVVGLAAWGIASGFATGILNMGIFPFLEHGLNVATPFRLLELSDLNAPILKRMLTLAPGTYGHTVMVANLAESACREIGANPLLARVGAYYHDIGKIDQADYFVENQTGDNKHDELKPSLSVAVIKSHVKIGIEKAKELGLPLEVIDIIAQHHGSQLIHYFYAQAVNTDTSEQVNRRDYSYGGLPPVSKEAAVVMLADGIEAASRTLKKPTVARLEKFVWKIMLDKVSAEQMSNSELSFRDLDTIKRSFVHILAGQFHSRIEYPELEEDHGRSVGAS